ncbi:MAG: PAS domain-containing protein [Proteobacteria bacterium]|nr:PAS domain-containing protein [Pseudomonadota bacterium]
MLTTQILPFAGYALAVVTSAYALFVRRALGNAKKLLIAERSNRIRAESTLADREQRLRQIIATEPECVKIQSQDGTILEMNPAGLHLIDAEKPEDIVGRSVYHVISPAHCEIYEKMTRKVFAGHHVKFEFQIISLKGRTRWLETHAAPLRDKEGCVTSLLGITRDISELKRYEDELHLHHRELSIASRLSSMGQMTTALAHQLNQPLAAIANFSRGCLYRLDQNPNDPEVRWAMEHVCKQADRAADIIASVRRFLVKGDPAFRKLDVQVLISNALRVVLPESQSRGIAIRVVPSPLPTYVKGDAIQLEQVILNIVRNAIEAIDGSQASSKVVTITTDATQSDAVQILISDSGSLLPDPDLDKIFEPFFTTKSMGMGMGLPISRSIVEAHRGQLRVTSNSPECGLTFAVNLPLAHRELAYAS